MFANRASFILYNFLQKNCINENQYYLLPSNICFEVIAVFITAKTSYKFIDLNDELTDFDFSKIDFKDKNLRGLLYTHLYGNEYTPNDVFKNIKSENPNIYIIDDRCLCLPDINFMPSENVDLTIFSTGDKKQVDLGYGGFGISNNLDFSLSYNEAKVNDNSLNIFKKNLQTYGRIDKNNELDACWMNRNSPNKTIECYFNEIESKKCEMSLHRNTIKAIYNEKIPSIFKYPEPYQNWRFNIKCANKDEVIRSIFNNNLFASNHYYPIHLYHGVICQNSERIFQHTINLFQDSYFTQAQAEGIVIIIKKSAIPIEI